jgi:hypothetical protein
VLVNVPAPEPRLTVDVGKPELVPYTKPLALTCVAPSSVTLPPKTAVVVVILVAVVVAAKVGFTDVELKVVKLCAAP